MWDSKYTDYKVTNTPCGRDLLREIVDAFRAEGLKVGFYHSLIDWHHRISRLTTFTRSATDRIARSSMRAATWRATASISTIRCANS